MKRRPSPRNRQNTGSLTTQLLGQNDYLTGVLCPGRERNLQVGRGSQSGGRGLEQRVSELPGSLLQLLEVLSSQCPYREWGFGTDGRCARNVSEQRDLPEEITRTELPPDRLVSSLDLHPRLSFGDRVK